MIKQLLPNKIITIKGMLFVLNLFLLRDDDWFMFYKIDIISVPKLLSEEVVYLQG